MPSMIMDELLNRRTAIEPLSGLLDGHQLVQ